jgi:hypothetical protein
MHIYCFHFQCGALAAPPGLLSPTHAAAFPPDHACGCPGTPLGLSPVSAAITSKRGGASSPLSPPSKIRWWSQAAVWDGGSVARHQRAAAMAPCAMASTRLRASHRCGGCVTQRRVACGRVQSCFFLFSPIFFLAKLCSHGSSVSSVYNWNRTVITETEPIYRVPNCSVLRNFRNRMVLVFREPNFAQNWGTVRLEPNAQAYVWLAGGASRD